MAAKKGSKKSTKKRAKKGAAKSSKPRSKKGAAKRSSKRTAKKGSAKRSSKRSPKRTAKKRASKKVRSNPFTDKKGRRRKNNGAFAKKPGGKKRRKSRKVRSNPTFLGKKTAVGTNLKGRTIRAKSRKKRLGKKKVNAWREEHVTGKKHKVKHPKYRSNPTKGAKKGAKSTKSFATKAELKQLKSVVTKIDHKVERLDTRTRRTEHLLGRQAKRVEALDGMREVVGLPAFAKTKVDFDNAKTKIRRR